MIKKTQDNTKDHVSDTKDDGDFHLQRIGECQLVARQLPNLKKKTNHSKTRYLFF